MPVDYICEIDYGVADEHVQIDDIKECSDEATLLRWYTGMGEIYDHIKAHLSERRDADIGTDDYYDATAGKLAFLKIGQRHVERRMLELGFCVPYPPHDPRTKQIRLLEEKLKKLKNLLKANGIEFEKPSEVVD